MDPENTPPKPESQEEFFSRIRPMLQDLAEDLIARDLQSKIDASDLVQQTMLEAYEDLETLKSKDPIHVDSWLRSMLVNNFLDAVRYFRESLKRDVTREEPLTPILHNKLTDSETGSSRRESELKRMHAAMGKLPSAHQQ
ncbi:MAG: sigma factor, partial [Pirellula sp.]